MSTSFDFDEPDHFTVGTVGEPGHRIFFLQAAQSGSVATLRLEKQQVAALAEYLAGILADLPDADAGAVEAGSRSSPPSRNGSSAPLGRRLRGGDRPDPAGGRRADPPGRGRGSDDDLLESDVPTGAPDDEFGDDSATARFRLTRAQVAGFIARAATLVLSGRPICPLCGDPSTLTGTPARGSTDRSGAIGPVGSVTDVRQLLVRGRADHQGSDAVELQRHVPGRSRLRGRRHRQRVQAHRGERPLWDFPTGLFKREVAAYELSEALGWGLVPRTVLRAEGPLGEGSLQEFVDADFEQHYFTLYEDEQYHDQLRAICAFDLLANNTDRKSGHCLLGRDGRIYAIDNGLSFHHEFKLRTVIWEFGGEPVPAASCSRT